LKLGLHNRLKHN